MLGISTPAKQQTNYSILMKSIFAGIFIFLLGLFSSLEAQQQVQVAGDMDMKVEYQTQQTPDFQAGNVKGKKIPNPRDWLEIEVMFKPKTNPREAVIPKLMFKYYVAIQAEGGQTQVITGDVAHINVLGEEEHFSVAYVSPATLGKITGDPKRFQEGAIKGVAVEVFHNGISKGGASNGGPGGRWWESMAVSPGVLAKNKTPFQFLWIDRYADFEQE